MFDWNRMGLDGKPRELHVRKAADVLNYHAGGVSTLAQIAYRYEGLDRMALIADPRFTVERVIATPIAASIATNARPRIIMSLEHPMAVRCGASMSSLQKYQTVLIPAAAEACWVTSAGPNAPFLLVTPPKLPNQLAARLLAAGIPEPQIMAFSKQFTPSQAAAV
jgi:mannose-6-phosphate isomerase